MEHWLTKDGFGLGEGRTILIGETIAFARKKLLEFFNSTDTRAEEVNQEAEKEEFNELSANFEASTAAAKYGTVAVMPVAATGCSAAKRSTYSSAIS